MNLRKVLLLALGMASSFLFPVSSHETNFGISPSTLHKGGVHIESNVTWDRKTETYEGSKRISDTGGQRFTEARLDSFIHYGLTPTWTIGMQIPYVNLESKTSGSRRESEDGFDKWLFDVKYRFFKKDTFAGTHYASLVAHYSPGGPKTGVPRLDDGADSWLLGVGTSFVRPVISLWLNGAVRWHDKESGKRLGSEIVASFAMGYRPWIAERNELEYNYMLEFNYEHQERARDRAGEIGSSGREVVFFSPGIRVNYNRQLIKAGVQIPVSQTWHGTQLGYGLRYKLGWEWMF